MYLLHQFNRGKFVAIAFSLVITSSLNAGPGNYNQQGPKLVGSGYLFNSPSGSSGDIGVRQGFSAAISADGNTAITGGPFDNNLFGAAWVFTRSNGVWTQQGEKLVPTDAFVSCSFCHVVFGESLALSADGNTAVVGGPADDGFSGSVWVFTRSGGVWTQQGSKLSGTGARGTASQGLSVAISADGDTLFEQGQDDDDGKIWCFTRSGGVWTQQGSPLEFPYLAPVNSAQSQALFDLAISADANTLAVGEWANSQNLEGDSDQVSGVWVITRSGGVWTQQLLYTAGEGLPPVSLTADGNTLLTGRGFYYRKDGVWSQNGPQCTPGGGCANYLSPDGSTAVGPGLAVYVKTGGAWIFHQYYAGSGAVGPSTGPGAVGQGTSVALSANGNTMFEGGPEDGNFVGATWVFASPQLSTALAHTGNFHHGQTSAQYTITVKNIGDREIHAAPTSAVNVIDKLPAGLIPTAISGPGWNCTLATVSCTRQDGLGIGASFAPVTVTVSVANNAASKVTNVATASGGGSNWGNASDVTFIVP